MRIWAFTLARQSRVVLVSTWVCACAPAASDGDFDGRFTNIEIAEGGAGTDGSMATGAAGPVGGRTITSTGGSEAATGGRTSTGGSSGAPQSSSSGGSRIAGTGGIGTQTTGGATGPGGMGTGASLAVGGASGGGQQNTGGRAPEDGGAAGVEQEGTGGWRWAGGAPSTSGAATGGANTGGIPSTGGAATGGANTGGIPSTGGAATGGANTGGIPSTGGAAGTGGATDTPCAGLCDAPVSITSLPFSTSNLPATELCYETMLTIANGNCGNMSGRTLSVNGRAVACSDPMPAGTFSESASGTCIHITAGTGTDAWFGLW